MNLWTVFPEFIIHIPGIYMLPTLIIPLYLYVVYALFKHPSLRIPLSIFLVLTLAASLVMFLSMGPRIGLVLPPLLLLSVMLMPLGLLVHQLIKKDKVMIKVWSIVTVAGWVHSLSWFVWLLMLARS